MLSQETFSPKIIFTPDGWYRLEANKLALLRRNARAKELEAQGYHVKKFSLGNQLISAGGIGSGHPHIEEWVKAYGLMVL